MKQIDLIVNTGKAKEDHLKIDPAAPFNMVYHPPGDVDRIDAPGFIRLDPESCIYHAHRVKVVHPRLSHYVELITGESLSHWGSSWQGPAGSYDRSHLFGRLDMSLKLLQVARERNLVCRLFWVMPEAGLHPCWQTGLGDAMVRMQQEGAD